MAQTITLNLAVSPTASPKRAAYIKSMMKYAFNQMGLAVNVRYRPDKRSLIEANSGEVDGEVGRISSIVDVYPHLLVVPESIINFDLVAYSFDDDIDLSQFTLNTSHYHVGYIHGWKIAEELLAGYANKTKVSNRTKLYELLLKNRIDIAIGSMGSDKEILMQLTRVLPVDQRSYQMSVPLASQKLYLVMHDRHRDLLKNLAQHIKAFKEIAALK